MNTSPDMNGKPGVNLVEMMKIALLSNATRMNAYVQKYVMVSPDENAPPPFPPSPPKKNPSLRFPQSLDAQPLQPHATH